MFNLIYEKQKAETKSITQRRNEDPNVICIRCGNQTSTEWSNASGSRATKNSMSNLVCLSCRASHYSRKKIDRKTVESLQAKILLQLASSSLNSLRPFLCDVCGFSFLTKQHLKWHEETHKKDSHVCDVCKNIFSTQASKEQHIRKYHK